MNRTEKIDPAYCKVTVATGNGWHFRQCSKKVVRDGYCTIHHPDYIAEQNRRRDADRQETLYEKLWKAHERIRELESQIADLRTRLESRRK